MYIISYFPIKNSLIVFPNFPNFHLISNENVSSHQHIIIKLQNTPNTTNSKEIKLKIVDGCNPMAFSQNKPYVSQIVNKIRKTGSILNRKITCYEFMEIRILGELSMN